jgi:hypothetical protein
MFLVLCSLVGGISGILDIKKSLTDHFGPAQADYQRLRIQRHFTRKNVRRKFGYLKNGSMRSKTW